MTFRSPGVGVPGFGGRVNTNTSCRPRPLSSNTVLVPPTVESLFPSKFTHLTTVTKFRQGLRGWTLRHDPRLETKLTVLTLGRANTKPFDNLRTHWQQTQASGSTKCRLGLRNPTVTKTLDGGVYVLVSGRTKGSLGIRFVPSKKEVRKFNVCIVLEQYTGASKLVSLTKDEGIGSSRSEPVRIHYTSFCLSLSLVSE